MTSVSLVALNSVTSLDMAWFVQRLKATSFTMAFRGGADFTLNEAFTPSPGAPTEFRTAQRNVTTWINTGTWLANFILRFAPGDQKFQPYIGAGVGIYYAESAGVEVNDPVTGAVPINTGGGASHADLAFDALAGADYFFRPSGARLSSINTSIIRAPNSIPEQNRALGQQLVGAGVRFFF